MNFLGETSQNSYYSSHYGDLSYEGHSSNETHCGEHAEEEVLFSASAIYYFDTDVFFLMVVVVIAFVLLVDFLFHVLHFLTHESPFNKMINAVEKELMTVGFTAFVFKILINSIIALHSKHKNWVLAFELADLMVPVFSFCNCLLGLILVFLSIRQCNKWSKASNLDLSELLDRFYDDKRHWLTNLLPNMFNSDIGKMEFRIFHNIFCEMYSLKRDAFAFDEYVNNVFEQFIFTIVKIRPINWICLCLLLFLDYARRSNELYISDCEKEDEQCIEENSIRSFAIVGSIVFGITVIFYIAAHYYESRIIIEKGINGYDYYPTYLQFMEDEQCIQGERLNEEELKEAALDMRRAYLAHQHHKSHSLIKHKKDKSAKHALADQLVKRNSKTDFIEQLDKDRVVEFMQDRLKSKNSFVQGEIEDAESQSDRDKINAFCPPELAGLDSLSAAIGGSFKEVNYKNTNANNNNNSGELSDGSSEASDENAGKDSRGANGLSKSTSSRSKTSNHSAMHMKAVKSLSGDIEDNDEEEEESVKQRQDSARKHVSNEHITAGHRTESDAEILNNSMTRMTSEEFRSHSQRSKLDQFHSTSTQLTADNNIVLHMFKSRQKKHERVKDIFLFSSPTFFFEFVKLLVMLISLNLAFWLIYFIGSGSSHGWKFLSIAPPILSFIVYVDVVKTAALLKAVSSLDTDAMVEVIELSEEAQRLEEEVRREIVETLFKKAELAGLSLEDKLKKVYEQIDADGNGHMTRLEFTEFLHTLEIYPSRKALRQIFRKMDRNVDNDISLAEFTLFIMPDNNKANIEEAQRLEEVRIRVTAKTIELAELMKRRQENPTLWDRILGRNHHPLSEVAGESSKKHASSAKLGGYESVRQETPETKMQEDEDGASGAITPVTPTPGADAGMVHRHHPTHDGDHMV